MHKDLFVGSIADGIHQVQRFFRGKTKQKETRRKAVGPPEHPSLVLSNAAGDKNDAFSPRFFARCISSGPTQTLSCFYLGYY